MIDNVYIKNFALAKELDISFSKGFNVLVGETGAGKSIIISAILFALGSKVDKTIIRTDEKFVKVSVSFSGVSNLIKDIYSIDNDETLVISRLLTIDGKNECRINGEPISLAELRNIGNVLVDCCSQHESVNVLKVKNQLSLLDQFVGIEIDNLLINLKSYISQYKEICKEIDLLGGGDKENKFAVIDLLTYQINEIKNANLKENEDVELYDKIQKISSTEKISSSLNQTAESFDGNMGIIYLLKNSLHLLQSISKYDDVYVDFCDRIQSSIYEIEDIFAEIKGEKDKLFYDEKELERLDKRLDMIKELKRKYGSTIEEINLFLNNAQEKLDTYLHSDEKLNKLELQKKNLLNEIYNLCLNISNVRRKSAKVLESMIMKEFCDLSMNNAVFKIDFNDVATKDDFDFTDIGFDKIEFMFSANKGENIKSLSKTISGGELSRFMLAFKNVFAKIDNVGSIILDEIDSGISGETGSKVAQKIANISKQIQVICISHMQQVAAMADNYIYVEKIVEGEKTESKIKILNENQQVEYIARISAGDELTESAIAHAKELKLMSNKYKNQIN